MDGREVGAIPDGGLLVLVAIAATDGPEEIAWMAAKIAQTRIFADESGKMNRSLLEAGRGALLVSQFTLYADVRKGRRPSFVGAAPGDVASPRFERLVEAVRAQGVHPVATGVFGADMQVSLCNDGPVTLVLDTP